MSSNVKDVLQAPILRFDILESTNNYAAKIIDADKAQAGLTIVAREQSAGRGQRGNSWKGGHNQSLLMSIVLRPTTPIDEQFVFLSTVAVAVAQAIQSVDQGLRVRIKFPNDIIVNDKKAAGILIENALRGNHWTQAIIGLGINVLQSHFEDLPQATSLLMESGKAFSIEDLMVLTRTAIVERAVGAPNEDYVEEYNRLLFKNNERQSIRIEGTLIEVTILGVSRQGFLHVQLPNGTLQKLAHGSFSWVW